MPRAPSQGRRRVPNIGTYLPLRPPRSRAEGGIPSTKPKNIEPSADGAPIEQLRELKVKIPVELHVLLHTLRIRDRAGISEVVAEALREYFAKRGETVPHGD